MIDRPEVGQTKGRMDPAGRRPIEHLLRLVGWFGVLVTIPFFVWVPAAWFGLVPSMIDVFSVVGLRIPASITIGGLLLAAIGFHKF
jgi:hypothetical protein